MPLLAIKGWFHGFKIKSPKISLMSKQFEGDLREELMHKFLGGGLQLRSLATLVDPIARSKLQTVAMGGN